MKFLVGVNLLIIVLTTFLVMHMWGNFSAVTAVDLVLLGALNALALLINGTAVIRILSFRS